MMRSTSAAPVTCEEAGDAIAPGTNCCAEMFCATNEPDAKAAAQARQLIAFPIRRGFIVGLFFEAALVWATGHSAGKSNVTSEESLNGM